jgi:multidrug efflux system membrane fusion protein
VPRFTPALALAALAACSLAGCGDKGAAPPDAKKSAPAVPVLTAVVVEKRMPVRLHAIGTVEPMASVAIKARVDGLITRAYVRDGQDVVKGDLLFQLDPKPFEAQMAHAQADLARDVAQLEHSKGQERRYKELLDRNFVSPEAYAQVSANLQALESTIKGDESEVNRTRINLGYATIRSPINGRAGKVLLTEGNLVKANDTEAMVVINQLSPIYVSLSIPQQYFEEIRRMQARAPLQVEVPPEYGKTAGKLAFSDNAIDASTGTIKLRGRFDNAGKLLWPGQFVDAWLTLREEPAARVVPSQAVQNGPKGQYVYVVKSDATVDLREVTVARIEGPETVISAGLEPGETVVVDGASRLLPGSKVSARNSDKPS